MTVNVCGNFIILQIGFFGGGGFAWSNFLPIDRDYFFVHRIIFCDSNKLGTIIKLILDYMFILQRNTVKPVLSGHHISGHPLLSGQ